MRAVRTDPGGSRDEGAETLNGGFGFRRNLPAGPASRLRHGVAESGRPGSVVTFFHHVDLVGFDSEVAVGTTGENPRVNEMMRMGPEALMVLAKTAPRGSLEMYARAQFAREDARWMQKTLRRELDELPVKQTPMLRLRRAVGEWFGLATPRIEATPTSGTTGSEGYAERRARGASLPGVTLAAIPASQAGFGRERGRASIAAAPIYSLR